MRSAVDTTLSLHTLDARAGHEWLAQVLAWPDAEDAPTLERRRLWPDRDGAVVEYVVRHPRHAPSGAVLVAFDRELRKSRPIRNQPRWRSTGLHGVRVRGPEGTGWCITPDQDPRQPVLRQILRRHIRPAELGLPDDPAPTLINYRALSRAVLRYAADDRIEYAKCLRRPPPAERWPQWEALGHSLLSTSGGRVRSPALRPAHQEPRVLISPKVPHGQAPTAMDLGEVLLAFQHVRRLDLPAHGPTAERRTLQRWCDLWARLMNGAVPAAVVGVQRHLAAASPVGPLCVVHRDFHSGQVLACGQDKWVLDLDTLAVGHPEVDVATWAAHVVLHQLQDGASRDQSWTTVIRDLDLLRGIGVTADPARLTYYLPVALCRLGLNYALRRIPTNVTVALWRTAADIAAGTLSL